MESRGLIKAAPPPSRPGGDVGQASSAAVALAVLLSTLAAPTAALASDEPLTSWLGGIGTSAQALSEGRAPEAERAARTALAARPRGAAAARARAALGLALAASDRPVEAAQALESALATVTASARPHLALARGEALLAAGDAAGAARMFELAGQDPGLAVAVRARFRAADALLQAGLAAEAVPLLERLLDTAPGDPRAPSARLALARARRTVGDQAGAVAALRALWLEADLPEARVAGDALAAWRGAGGPVPPSTREDHLARAARLVATARPEDALGELALAGDAEEEAATGEPGGPSSQAPGAPPVPPAGPPASAAPAPPSTDGRGDVLRALALVALGKPEEAEPLAVQHADAPDESVRRSARFVLARTAARAGRFEEASRRWAEVAASAGAVPGLPEWRQRDLQDEAAYLSAWLWYDAGAFARAADALDRFAQRHPASRRAEEALWFAAWSRYRLRPDEEAARAFARLSRGPLADAAAYWQARLAGSPGRRRALYRTAAAIGGDGWYGLLARARLAGLGETAPRPARAAARPLPDTADATASKRLAIAVELFALGLREEGLEELRDLARQGRVRTAAPLVAQLAAAVGDAELPFRMARDHLAPTRRALRWSHPEPMGEAARARAAGFGVDPGLLFAVMRRESSFRAAVRSGAGAEGLLQLRPVTAERLAALLGVPGGVGARLADPATSVELGAHYLGLLQARFGDPALAVAAYNAGPRAVAAWARDREGLPLDAWVECIPYRETRQYVKVVLPDWDVYRGLAGAPPPPLDPGHRVAAPPGGVDF